MNKLTRMLKALSNETRLRILNILFVRDCCVCEIMQVLAMSQPRVSHHLGEMHNAGLVIMTQHGLFSLYAIDWENLDACGADVLEAIRKGLKENKLAKQDSRKLAQAGSVLADLHIKQKSNLIKGV
jgi:ArsR family transcriptional regulator, arsenate/arsenite/antimonite-responsive transcriptional repressor